VEVEIVPLLLAGTIPSGPWTDDTLTFFEDLLRTQVQKAGALDGVALALHGASAGVVDRDLDGRFLEILRELLGDDIPIAVPLDLHAMVTKRMAQHATALVSYRTHPHIDHAETGAKAARILLQTMLGEIIPVQVLRQLPMTFSDTGTNIGTMREIFADLAALDVKHGGAGGRLLCGYLVVSDPSLVVARGCYSIQHVC
jgi:microcystin degradation protein MlrC